MHSRLPESGAEKQEVSHQEAVSLETVQKVVREVAESLLGESIPGTHCLHKVTHLSLLYTSPFQ